LVKTYLNIVFCDEGTSTDECYEKLKKLLKKYNYVILVSTDEIDMEELMYRLEKDFKNNLIVEDIKSGEELGVDYIIKFRKL